MKVVLDTNVLISATIAQGIVHKLFAYCITEHDIFTSKYIQREYEEKLLLKFKYTKQEAAIASEVIFRTLEFVKPAVIEIPDLLDKADLPVIGTAISANAEYLVTGDKELLKLKSHSNVTFIAPADFAKLVGLRV